MKRRRNKRSTGIQILYDIASVILLIFFFNVFPPVGFGILILLIFSAIFDPNRMPTAPRSSSNGGRGMSGDQSHAILYAIDQVKQDQKRAEEMAQMSLNDDNN